MFRRLLRWALTTLALPLVIASAAGWFILRHASDSLPPLPDLHELRPAYGTRIQSQDGAHLGGVLAVEPVDYHELPPMLLAAFLAAEDEDFFKHEGYNLRSILRALFSNYRAGERLQGASTFTQQVAKHFLSSEKTFQRKLQELLLARQIEAHYTKEEILSAYLGGVYFGQQAWGVTMASHRYFSRPPSELTTGQMATLAGLLPAPSVYNPVDNPELATAQRNRVLRRMHDIGILSENARDRLQAQPLEGPVPFARPPSPAPEATGTVLRNWEEVGRDRNWDSSDLEVVTTHSPAHQSLARQALQRGIEAHDRRTGFRGPIARTADPEALIELLDQADHLHNAPLVPALITAVDDAGLQIHTPSGPTIIAAADLSWIHGLHPRTERPRRRTLPWQSYFQPGDIVIVHQTFDTTELWQSPATEGAFLLADHHSQELLASVGAYDVAFSQFHRAEQACRQPGSLFKTVLFAEAFAQGLTLATLLSDVPTDVDSRSGVWQPRNADRDFRGYLTALDAFAASRNIPAVNLLAYTGTDSVIDRARNMGVTSLLDPTPSLALGASCTRPTEMLRVHATVARGGLSMQEQSLAYIRDLSTGRIHDQGHFLQRDPALLPRIARAAASPIPPKRALTPSANFLLTQALRDVVTRGTARDLRDEWPLFAKTGTSSNFDTWLAAFDPAITAIVWVGSDQNDRPFESSEHGATVALPIFADFYDGLTTPLIDGALWPSPPPQLDVEFIPIDPRTGLRARQGEPGRPYPFLKNTAPRQYAPTTATRHLQRFESLLY